MARSSQDEVELLALLTRVRQSVAARDFDAYSDCWMHVPYAARWNASRVGGVFVRQGWQEIAERTRQSFAEGREPLPGGQDVDAMVDLDIRINGDFALVTFRRTYADVPPHRAGPDDDYHLRLCERHEGRWKLVLVGFLDPGMGRRDVARIRLGPDGTVVWLDAAATERMAREDDLVVRNGRLQLRDSIANQKLQAAIRWAAELDSGVVPNRGAMPIVLDAGEGIPARIWWVIAESGGIYFTFGEEGHEQRLDAAAAAYGLSPGQRAVAGHIVRGLTMPQIARVMSVRPNTIRTHLDRVFEKTGVRNQTALVRVLLSAAAP